MWQHKQKLNRFLAHALIVFVNISYSFNIISDLILFAQVNIILRYENLLICWGHKNALKKKNEASQTYQ